MNLRETIENRFSFLFLINGALTSYGLSVVSGDIGWLRWIMCVVIIFGMLLMLLMLPVQLGGDSLRSIEADQDFAVGHDFVALSKQLDGAVFVVMVQALLCIVLAWMG